MFKTQVFSIMVVTLFLVLLVLIFGQCFLNTAEGNVVLNVISDIFFAIILLTLFAIGAWIPLAKPKAFFGISRRWPLTIVVSTHPDETTVTKAVITKVEYDIADELRDTLTRQLPGFIGFWAELLGVNVQIPGILIKSSPLNTVEEWPNPGSLILIGGPTRNRLTEYYLAKGNPWITFDDNDKKFIVRKNRQQDHEEILTDINIMILEKLIVDGRVGIIVFGHGELQTKAIVQYFMSEWNSLADKHQKDEFAYLMSIDGENLRIVREYS
jgi:hypothetical protein